MQRIIARLDIKNEHVIKGIHLEGQRRIGDPVELARKYYDQGIDEILMMDSVASLYGRNNLFHTISEACKMVFVPITMGGGIRSLADIEDALAAGADKVSINSALVKNPRLAEQISTTYGSQCLVASIEAKQREKGHWEAYISNGREPTGYDVMEWARRLEGCGVGEILLTSVDREGTQRGFDLELCKALQGEVRIPIIISGGAGSLSHIQDVDSYAAPQAIALASILHYNKATVPQIKSALPHANIRRQNSDCCY